MLGSCHGAYDNQSHFSLDFGRSEDKDLSLPSLIVVMRAVGQGVIEYNERSTQSTFRV